MSDLSDGDSETDGVLDRVLPVDAVPVRSGAEIDAVLRVVDAEPVRDRAVEKDKDSDCELVTETLRLAVTVNENV